MIQDSGFRIQDSGFRVQGAIDSSTQMPWKVDVSGFRIQGAGSYRLFHPIAVER
jgi:hypothetical protein